MTVLELTITFVFLTIGVESVFLILQLRGRLMSKWLGKNAFATHATVTCALWIVTFLLIALLQTESHPPFHKSAVFSYIGLGIAIPGLILSIWAFLVLGLKRALCANFYYDDVPAVKSSIYRYMQNPMDTGFWAALLGFAVFSGSIYNLTIALEFIALMLPHAVIENIPLKED